MGKPHHSQLSEINHVCVHAAAPRSPLSLDGVFTHTYAEVQAAGLGAHCQSLSSDGRVCEPQKLPGFECFPRPFCSFFFRQVDNC